MSTIPITPLNGDRYVWSKDLYQALDLSSINYSQNLKAWFDKEYLFANKKTFTKPVANYDYILTDTIMPIEASTQSVGQIMGNSGFSYRGKKTLKTGARGGRPTDNYLIRFEFAKLIALDSNSKLKKQFVQWLLSLEARYESLQLLSRETLLGLMEMVKLCTYIDNQLEYYRGNKDKYFEDKEDDDKWTEFDKWRNSILQLLTDDDLTEKFIKVKGKSPGKKMTKVEKIAILDSLESIRVSLFDFLSLQLSPYTDFNLTRARDLADFVKKMFETAGFTQIDIKPKGFSPNGQLDLFRQIQEIDVKLISKTLKELQPVL